MHAILLTHFADVAKIDFQSLLSLADEGIDVSFLRPGIFLVVCLVVNKFALLRGFFLPFKVLLFFVAHGSTP